MLKRLTQTSYESNLMSAAQTNIGGPRIACNATVVSEIVSVSVYVKAFNRLPGDDPDGKPARAPSG